MSGTDGETIDFTYLEGETDTDVNGDILQPHLPPPPSNNPRRNARERGVVVVDEESRTSQSVDEAEDSDRDGNINNAVEQNRDTFDHNSNHVETNTTPNGSTPTPSVTVTNQNNESANQTRTAPVQICYSKNTGTISVRETEVATRPDGTRYIATQQIPEQWDEAERRPLKKKRIMWIKIFSIVACVLFFPTGIAAIYYAFRIEREFQEGILRGNIDRAQKFATRSERLIILSIVLCILTAAVVVTLIERPHFKSEHYHRGTITG